jgi:hypothetical protein
MLQAGRLQVRFPVRSLIFLIDLILQPQCGPGVDSAFDMSTRNLPGGEGWPVYRAENLTTMCDLVVYKMCEP